MNEDKLKKIFDQYYLLVTDIAYSVLRDYHAAQDVCQEVFLKFCEKMGTMEEARIKPWLILAAKNKAIDYKRAAYRKHEMQSSETLEACYYKVESLEKHMRDLEYRNLRNELFGRLKEEKPEFLNMIIASCIEGKSGEQIAREFGISEENVRTKLHRARLWIRSHYGSKYEELKW